MSLENGFTEQKRHRQMRIRDYRAKTRLSIENGARIDENVFSEGKRDKQVKTSLAKAKTLLPSETITRKSENVYTEPKRLTFKVINGLPSEDVRRKG